MSLTRFALRTAALHAIRGATLVGDNVRDSDITAIDVASDGAVRTEEDRPFIVIFTDDGNAEDTDLRDLRQNGAVDFVCEFGIATPMTVIDDATAENRILGVPATDENFEMVLDIIDRQIVAALTALGPWADLWRRLHNRVIKIERRRAASAEDGARMAARQLRIRVEAIADPAWGQPIAARSVWKDFLALLEAEDPELHPIAVTFLGPQDPAITADLIRRARGNTLREMRSLGYGPFHEGGEAYTIQTPVIEDV